MRRMKTLAEPTTLNGMILQQLRDAMHVRGVTQNVLAERLGITQASVSHILNSTNIAPSTIERLASAIGIQVSFLISDE